VAEADETYLLRSYKGQRRRLAELPTAPARQSRRRGGHARKRRLSAEHVPILVLRTDGSNMLVSVARELGIEHHAVNIFRGERTCGARHIQNVNAYHGRF